MTQLVRLSSEFQHDIGKARENARAIWRDVMIARGAVLEGDPIEYSERAPPLPLSLKGRYLAGDASEFEGAAVEISAAGLRLEGPWSVPYGAWCVASLADLGIVEGIVVETGPSSFVLAPVAPPIRLQRLTNRLAWRMRRDNREIEDRRSSQRVEMKHSTAALRTTDGRETPCQVFDISEGGAALHLGPGALYFWVDQEVELNDRPGRVLRYFPGGLVIKFDSAVAEE